ncbi:hypothetical protein LZ30DRAFT_704520 [Colletotrichum cereale]|nr:hypothetical protein LZ30DRAFT_704520 [Colletotrichum cereale]
MVTGATHSTKAENHQGHDAHDGWIDGMSATGTSIVIIHPLDTLLSKKGKNHPKNHPKLKSNIKKITSKQAADQFPPSQLCNHSTSDETARHALRMRKYPFLSGKGSGCERYALGGKRALGKGRNCAWWCRGGGMRETCMVQALPRSLGVVVHCQSTGQAALVVLVDKSRQASIVEKIVEKGKRYT